MAKLRVGILFGGRSGEHEVSLLSAASVLKAIDKTKYEVVPIGITKDGRWVTAAPAERLLHGIAGPGRVGGGSSRTIAARSWTGAVSDRRESTARRRPRH